MVFSAPLCRLLGVPAFTAADATGHLLRYTVNGWSLVVARISVGEIGTLVIAMFPFAGFDLIHDSLPWADPFVVLFSIPAAIGATFVMRDIVTTLVVEGLDAERPIPRWSRIFRPNIFNDLFFAIVAMGFVYLARP